MNLLMRNLTISLLVLSIFGTTQTRADCKDVISKCDHAIAAKKKEISLCQLGLQQSLDRSLEQDRTIEDKNRQLSSVFRNPFIMMALGAVVGIIVIK